MDDQGSLTRASRVKREVATSGFANGNPTRGAAERYAAAAATSLAKGQKRSNVAGFLAKAYQIFDTPAWSDICGWGGGGETVVIRKQIEFAQQILPLFFSHSNLQSFVRQLNMYNFRKVVQDPNSGEFKHDLFRQGNEHLLHKIKRKQSAAAANAASSTSLPQSGMYSVAGAVPDTGRVAMAGGIVEEADIVLDELVKLRKWKEDMENTVVELKKDKQTLQSENQMLKGQVAGHGQQQMLLQRKMQNILFCIYDSYASGLPALTESGEPQERGGNADANVKSESLVAANGSGTAAAGSALEKALQQLAALAGLNMSSRIDQLRMENPWTSGGEEGGGGGGKESSGDAAGAGAGAGGGGGGSGGGATNGAGLGGSGTANGGTSSNGGIVGGGSLKRGRTWSRTSYEWLRSLRDPDPLESIGSPASSAQAEAGSSGTPDANATAAAAPLGDLGFSTGNTGGMGGAGLSPDKVGKRQRKSSLSSLKVEVEGATGGSPPAAAAASSAAISLLPPPPPSGATAAAGVPPAAGAPAGGGAGGGGGGGGGCAGDSLHKSASFQADAPLSKGMSISSIVEEAEASRCGVAAAGGNEGSGEIWGGGALSRELSEQATQVVSELGEMGHREGEALTKLDSLGYQLANFLDPNMTFADIELFDEPTPTPVGDGNGDATEVEPTDGFSATAASGDGNGVAGGDDRGDHAHARAPVGAGQRVTACVSTDSCVRGATHVHMPK